MCDFSFSFNWVSDRWPESGLFTPEDHEGQKPSTTDLRRIVKTLNNSEDKSRGRSSEYKILPLNETTLTPLKETRQQAL